MTLQEELRQQAMKDLGIEITFEPGGSAQVLHKASTRPETFDLYEQWSNSIKVLWQAGAVQSIDTKRLRQWSQVSSLSKAGKLTAEAKYGAEMLPQTSLCSER